MSSQPGYTPVSKDIGVDISVPSLKTNVLVDNREYLAAIFHRKHLDLCFTDKVLLQQFPLSDGSVSIFRVSQFSNIFHLTFFRLI